MVRARIPDAQVDRAIEMLRSGVRPAEAATTNGMSTWTLYDRLRERGLSPRGEPGRTRQQRRSRGEQRDEQRARRDAAFALRERGLSFDAIGAELRTSRQGAHVLWLAALRERGLTPPSTSVPVRKAAHVVERRVATLDELARMHTARIVGGTCGLCGRALARDEAVYVDAFPIAEHLLSTGTRGTARLRGPVGVECAPPDLLAAVADREPTPCVGCGRGVLFRRVHASLGWPACSRRCRATGDNRRRREAREAPSG